MASLESKYAHLVLPPEAELITATAQDVVISVRLCIRDPDHSHITVWAPSMTDEAIRNYGFSDAEAERFPSANFLGLDVAAAEANDKLIWPQPTSFSDGHKKEILSITRGKIDLYLKRDLERNAFLRHAVKTREIITTVLGLKFHNL